MNGTAYRSKIVFLGIGFANSPQRIPKVNKIYVCPKLLYIKKLGGVAKW